MHVNWKAASAAVALCALATPALSDPFSGPYVGFELGYDAASGGPDGFTWGGYFGWNLRLADRFVVAPELRLSDSTAEETLVVPGVGTVGARAGRQVGAGVRAGYLFGDDLLLFGKVGWENIRVRSEGPLEVSATDDSVTIGGGLEYALRGRWSLRGGYDYIESSDRHRVTVGLGYNF